MTRLQRLFLEDVRAHCGLHPQEPYRPPLLFACMVGSCVIRGWISSIADDGTYLRGYRLTEAGREALRGAGIA